MTYYSNIYSSIGSGRARRGPRARIARDSYDDNNNTNIDNHHNNTKHSNSNSNSDSNSNSNNAATANNHNINNTINDDNKRDGSGAGIEVRERGSAPERGRHSTICSLNPMHLYSGSLMLSRFPPKGGLLGA